MAEERRDEKERRDEQGAALPTGARSDAVDERTERRPPEPRAAGPAYDLRAEDPHAIPVETEQHRERQTAARGEGTFPLGSPTGSAGIAPREGRTGFKTSGGPSGNLQDENEGVEPAGRARGNELPSPGGPGGRRRRGEEGRS